MENSVHELKLGRSFDPSSRAAFHSIRYDFKPASVDTTREATFEVGEGHQVSVTVPHVQGSGTSHTVYRGNKKPATKECVLIIDHDTGTYTLEKLTHSIPLKKTRAEGSSRIQQRPVTPVEVAKKSTSPSRQRMNQRSPSPVNRSSPSASQDMDIVMPDSMDTTCIGEISSSSDDSSSDDSESENESASLQNHIVMRTRKTGRSAAAGSEQPAAKKTKVMPVTRRKKGRSTQPEVFMPGDLVLCPLDFGVYWPGYIKTTDGNRVVVGFFDEVEGVDAYKNRSTTLDETETALRNLTKVEKTLINNQDMIEIRGKTGRGVPLLVPSETRKTLKFLSNPEIREKAGVKEDNKFLFANTGSTVVRAGSALDEVKSRLPLKAPDRILATNLRKHTATIAQVMSLNEQEMKNLCRHLGHTQKVHDQFYKQTSGMVERIDIAKLMLVQEYNLTSKYAGKTLEDIQLEEIFDDIADVADADTVEHNQSAPDVLTVDEDASLYLDPKRKKSQVSEPPSNQSGSGRHLLMNDLALSESGSDSD